MQNLGCILFLILPLSCHQKQKRVELTEKSQSIISEGLVPEPVNDTTSWAWFLQHLPGTKGPVLDYKGHPVAFQEKSFATLQYDVGTRDLQQCADALMRLRAEYLFAQGRFTEIGFHFTGGQYYRFSDYCKGLKPVPKGTDVAFVTSSTHAATQPELRRYLDIVYTYAGTISLAKELKTTNDFRIGTVVIYPGSPGHCFLIIDEAATPSGEKLYKLAEGYTPAQTIYVLRNLQEPSLGCWHRLKKGTIIETASYRFASYQLKKFE